MFHFEGKFIASSSLKQIQEKKYVKGDSSRIFLPKEQGEPKHEANILNKGSAKWI